MSKLILLRGNSGSGKTTVARALQRKFGRNTLLLSQDTVRREMLWAEDGPDTQALPLLRELLVYGKQHCETVLLEGILRADWYRPLFTAAVQAFGSRIFAYYYDLPFEETVRRHQTRPQKEAFGAQEMRLWWNEQDWIGFIPETRMDQTLTPDQAVERIFQEVTSADNNGT